MCGNNLAKGQRVFVQGRLQIRSYEANDGQKRRVAEVVAEIIAQNFEQSEQRGTGKPAQAAKPDDANSFGTDVTPDEPNW
jgi:single-strand DNA-binding protein